MKKFEHFNEFESVHTSELIDVLDLEEIMSIEVYDRGIIIYTVENTYFIKGEIQSGLIPYSIEMKDDEGE